MGAVNSARRLNEMMIPAAMLLPPKATCCQADGPQLELHPFHRPASCCCAVALGQALWFYVGLCDIAEPKPLDLCQGRLLLPITVSDFNSQLCGSHSSLEVPAWRAATTVGSSLKAKERLINMFWTVRLLLGAAAFATGLLGHLRLCLCPFSLSACRSHVRHSGQNVTRCHT